MARYFLLSLLLVLPLLSFSQREYDRAVTGLSAHKTSVARFTVPPSLPGHNVTALETPFAKAEFIAEALQRIATLKGKQIEKVQLVYTTFAVSPSFDQNGLNGRRLKNLFAALPSAFSGPYTEWELVAQTGAATPEEGRTYFHGFVITWRPDATPELIKQELGYLDSLFGKPGTGNSGSASGSSGSSSIGGGSSSGGSSSSGSSETTGGTTIVKTMTLPDGSKVTLDRDIPEDSLWQFMKPSGPGFSVVYAKYGDTAHTSVVVTEMSEMGVKRKRVWKLEDHVSDAPVRGSFDKSLLNTPDSVVLTTFRRNNWQNTTVVCDVTGSMSPYTAQFFSYLPTAIAGGKCSGFVFFNDGDHKSNNSKVVGKTGGIYSTTAMHFDTVWTVARRTMANGDGGDFVENDLEAVLFAINHMNNKGDIVLIADNLGPPRDLELYAKINRPLHIILCGVGGGINADYLFLARQTGGTVHTLKEDITNLSSMKEGETVKIGFQTFLLHDEHFIPLDKFSNVLQ